MGRRFINYVYEEEAVIALVRRLIRLKGSFEDFLIGLAYPFAGTYCHYLEKRKK